MLNKEITYEIKRSNSPDFHYFLYINNTLICRTDLETEMEEIINTLKESKNEQVLLSFSNDSFGLLR